MNKHFQRRRNYESSFMSFCRKVDGYHIPGAAANPIVLKGVSLQRIMNQYL